MDSNINLGKIVAVLKSYGIDNEYLGEKLGVKKEHVAKLKAGQSPMKYKYVEVIAELVKKPIEYFFVDENSPEKEKKGSEKTDDFIPSLEKIDTKIIDQDELQHLPPEIQQKLLKAEAQLAIQEGKLMMQVFDMTVKMLGILSKENLVLAKRVLGKKTG